jgi:uncharacterized protein YjbJ (UPF0337 family)
MKSSTQDRIRGKANEAKGKTKQSVGKRVGRPDIEEEGEAEELAGKVQRKVGEVKKVFGK